VVDEVRAALKVEAVSELLIDRYEDELRHPRVSMKYKRFEFDTLSTQNAFKNWRNSENSALLILDGHTLKSGPDNSDRFWASAAVFDLIESLKDSECLVISYFVELEESMVYDVPSYQIFGHLIWQILRHTPQLVQDTACIGELKKLADGKGWQNPAPKEPCQIIKKLLDHIPITFILLDRIDRCACHPTALLDSLLALIQECKSRVKIFTTFGERADKVLEIRSLKLTDVESQFMCVTLDQEKRHAH
jgi:hypothetical protein